MSGRVSAYIRQHHLALVALFVAMGGTAAALPGKNTVDSGDIKNGHVKASDLAAGAVKSPSLAPDSVATANVIDGTLLSADVANDALTGANINDLTAADIADTGSLGTAEVNEGDLFNDNSLDAADVADTNTLGTDEINEGSLFNDDSLDQADINESSLVGLAHTIGPQCCDLISEQLITDAPYSPGIPVTFTTIGQMEIRSSNPIDAGVIQVCNLSSLDTPFFLYSGGAASSTAATRTVNSINAGTCEPFDYNAGETDASGDFMIGNPHLGTIAFGFGDSLFLHVIAIDGG